MIRRIEKTNDLKDVIKSYPAGVIDDVHTLEYFIQGYDTKIRPAFTKEGSVLVCVLPAQDLKTLPNGVLYRRAYYSVEDASYPDGHYDLEMVDCMNIWLGEMEAVPVPPVPDDYLTPDDLKTINGQSIVGEGDIEISGVSPEQEAKIAEIDNKADKSEIPSLEGYATESWVEGKGYLTEIPDEYAKKTDIPTIPENVSAFNNDAGYLTEHQSLKTINNISLIGNGNIDIGDGITEEWVDNEIDIKLTGYASKTYVDEQTEETRGAITILYDKIEEVEGKIPSLDGYATESWVEGKGYLTEHQDISGKADITYVDDQIEQTQIQVTGLWRGLNEQIEEVEGKIPSLEGYATESWVEGKGYLTEHQDLSDYAKKTDIPDVSNFATKDEIPTIPENVSAFNNDAGYLTEHQDISGKVDKSSIWTGTQAEWDTLSDEQKASYTIALITE